MANRNIGRTFVHVLEPARHTQRGPSLAQRLFFHLGIAGFPQCLLEQALLRSWNVKHRFRFLVGCGLFLATACDAVVLSGNGGADVGGAGEPDGVTIVATGTGNVASAVSAVSVTGVSAVVTSTGTSSVPVEVSPNEGVTTFISIGSGWWHTCGILEDRTLRCWGGDLGSPPMGTFVRVRGGNGYACAMRDDGSVVCWGNVEFPPVPAIAFDDFGVFSYGGGCGVRDGNVTCWDFSGALSVVPGTFTAIAVGGFHACGIRLDGSLTCWGDNAWGQASPPGGTFVDIAAGGVATCGLRDDLSSECWGYSEPGQTVSPPEPITKFVGGIGPLCGVAPDGAAVCWGVSYLPGRVEGDFVDVSPGDFHVCALGASGLVTCWGRNDFGQATPP